VGRHARSYDLGACRRYLDLPGLWQPAPGQPGSGHHRRRRRPPAVVHGTGHGDCRPPKQGPSPDRRGRRPSQQPVPVRDFALRDESLLSSMVGGDRSRLHHEVLHHLWPDRHPDLLHRTFQCGLSLVRLCLHPGRENPPIPQGQALPDLDRCARLCSGLFWQQLFTRRHPDRPFRMAIHMIHD